MFSASRLIDSSILTLVHPGHKLSFHLTINYYHQIVAAMAKDDANTSNQTFSFEVVACLLAAMAESGVTVGSKYYTVMSQIDPARSSSGYEHHFRKVKARAKEINDMIASGDIKPAAVTPSKKGEGSKAGTPASGTKKGTKRGKSCLAIFERCNYLC